MGQVYVAPGPNWLAPAPTVQLSYYAVGMLYPGSRTGVKQSLFNFYVRPDERRCGFRVDRITIAAQSSHAVGSPMSQRECAGFNCPILVVSAVDPLCPPPESASETCRANWSSRERVDPSGFFPVLAMPVVSFQSLLLGVAHPVSFV